MQRGFQMGGSQQAFMPTYTSDRRRVPRGADRRRSLRRRERNTVEMFAPLSLLDAGESADETEEPLTFVCFTRDMSETGIALVIPSVRIDERFCEQHRSLRLKIDLPDQALEIRVKAIRCERLERLDPLEGYLIGAQFSGNWRSSS